MFLLRTGSALCALTVAAASLFAAPQSARADDHDSSRLAWRKSYKQAAEEARKRRRPILVKVTATWCGPCRQMQQLTFTDERVRRRLRKDFVLLEVDADENPDLVSGFHVESYPTTLVVSPELKVVKRLTGYQSAGDLVTALEMVKRSPLDESELDDSELESDDEIAPVSALAAVDAKPLAFDGFCLVSLLDDNKLRKGEPEFTTEHRGQTICFFSAEHRQKFLANPDRFWPVANGQCLVSSKESRRAEQGDPRAGVIWRGKLWFFSDRETQQRFIQMPHQYANQM